MPVQLSYPGVYIEEIPSGVRTITGVATSIAAFVGWAPQGPTDQAGLVLSWADYERAYGGLHPKSYLSYAVSHFFANGGQQAYVVRLVSEDAESAEWSAGGLTLTASGEGKWAEDYGIAVKRLMDDDGAETDRFGLTIVRGKDLTEDERQTVEVFPNLSLDPDDTRFVETVVNEESAIVNATVKSDEVPATAKADFLQHNGEEDKDLQPADTAFWKAVFPDLPDDGSPPRGVCLLDRVDLFNLLCVPGLTDRGHLGELAGFCQKRRAFLIADADEEQNFQAVKPISGLEGRNAALYHPWVRMPDPRQEGRLRSFPPSGVVAGIYARTDTTRGVWKAPAGIDASITGARGLKATLTDPESGILNQKAVNALRVFPVYGPVVWGARTCRGNDEIGDEWKYVPVRRTALFLEETLFRSLKWVVFEPNDEPLWAQIRLNVGAFMHDQFRKGAFQGATPRDAYFVRCDRTTTTQTDINLGIVNILVGFAPLKPAEFVVVKLQQMAGQVQV